MLTSFRKSVCLMLVMIIKAGVYCQEPVEINYSPPYMCALKGSDVMLSCSLPKNSEENETMWSKVSRETSHLCSDPEKRGGIQCYSKGRHYSITLNNIREADENIYYCRQKRSETWNLGVQLDVTDLQVETKHCVKEGDSVTLSCKSSCSLPEETTFIWYRNTKRLTGETLNNQLHLQSVRSSDAGDYICAVRGEEHLISPTAYLNVEYPPKSVSVFVSGSAVTVSGDSVTLSCSSDSNPPAEIRWLKGETSVGSGRVFSISNISSDHSGEYKCRARNRHGMKYSEAVMLNVNHPPSNISASHPNIKSGVMVQILITVGITTVSISVALMVFIVLFIRHHKKVESPEDPYMTLDPKSRCSEYDTLDIMKRSCENTKSSEGQDPDYYNTIYIKN
ncbi:B-cell receptor CD22-like [Danio aesculapii]|uniref:B-cell receptor CD22-like n=1 Tax=Danio aesculapii TaxID=1142201 RepID=UPI0024BF7249|nr:B-cell receptor CD22-like [Danio aesculapii]